MILQLQSWRNVFTDRLVKSFSVLGFEFVVPAIPFLVWHGSKSGRLHGLGLDILAMLLYVLCLMSILKVYFKEDRPVWGNHAGIMAVTGAAASGEKEFSFPSGHAWGTTAYWLLVMNHYQHYKWVPALALSSIAMCSFSRVWSAMHFPHDVIVGAMFGVISFWWRRWLLIFCPDKRQRHELAQLIVWGILTFVGFSSLIEHEHKKNQIGLVFSEGALASCIMMRYHVVILLDRPPKGELWTKRKLHIRRVARMILGVIPVVLGVKGTLWLGDILGETVDMALLFLCGMVVVIWLLRLGPFVFLRIGLATDVQRSELKHSHHQLHAPSSVARIQPNRSAKRSRSPSRRRL